MDMNEETLDQEREELERLLDDLAVPQTDEGAR